MYSTVCAFAFFLVLEKNYFINQSIIDYLQNNMLLSKHVVVKEQFLAPQTGRHRCANEVQPSLFLLRACDIVDVVFLFFFFLEKQIVSLSHWGVWGPGLSSSCRLSYLLKRSWPGLLRAQTSACSFPLCDRAKVGADLQAQPFHIIFTRVLSKGRKFLHISGLVEL